MHILDWRFTVQPKNYEQLISVSGIGSGAIRALSLIGEIIFGTKASWQDPANRTGILEIKQQ